MCEHNPRNKGQSYCAYCRVNELTATLTDLADRIERGYTPLAFRCDCRGAHPDCSAAIQDPGVYAQYETTRRIAEVIRECANSSAEGVRTVAQGGGQA